jgi:hypothetical protein
MGAVAWGLKPTPRDPPHHEIKQLLQTRKHLSRVLLFSASRIMRIDNGTMPPTLNAALQCPQQVVRPYFRLAPIPEPVLVNSQKQTNVAGSPIALEVQS